MKQRHKDKETSVPNTGTLIGHSRIIQKIAYDVGKSNDIWV